jgi:thioredoxin reductase/ferredoxin
MATFTMLSARKRHHGMVAPAQVVGPRVLIHDINDDRCTGCDACVAVCPTNVLDLVSNKSRVLRFQDCIQCEACMFACPTEALVMFPEGAVPPPLKVPEIDENFQTAVPGQYLIGEVAGKPLVKNAANLGRIVIEHMLQTGLRPMARGGNEVDVAIVGSGPGGLSAALTCIQKGLSYVVLEKEQDVASTISRYPKGKLVMAEPYDTVNLSLLPVFDSSKEQLIPIWKELIERVRLNINKGESVETVQRQGDGTFEIRTTVNQYRAQRVVLSIGTRGKPRTLQVQGENLPKVFSLLDDPDDWRGKNVLIVGGGDSACEAALALSDSGAKVMVSYRGKGFNRAAPKNKQTIEQYAAEGRIKVKLGSQVLMFDHDSVTLALADGTQKRYPNEAAFVLIGADPPVQWLEKMGVRFVERPHQYQLGKTDDLVRRFVARAGECPEDAPRAAAQILGGSTGYAPSAPAAAAFPMPMGEPVSGPRKWLRSATSIFSTKSNVGPLPQPRGPATDGKGIQRKKLDGPVPLSEFAKRQKTQHTHTGHGRRDQLTAGERTRILRMLRDEGGRMADEESQVFVGAPPAPKYDFDFDDEAGQVAAPPPARLDVPAKPAVVVGLQQANERRHKRQSGAPAAPPQHPPAPPRLPTRTKPPTQQPLRAPTRAKGATQPPPRPRPGLPKPFDEPTRAMRDDELLAAVRAAPGPGRVADEPVRGVRSAPGPGRSVFDEPTRMGGVDLSAFDNPEEGATSAEYPPKFLDAKTEHSPSPFDEEATRMANVDGSPRQPRTAAHDERTRAVDIRNDPSISDIDWDID